MNNTNPKRLAGSAMYDRTVAKVVTPSWIGAYGVPGDLSRVPGAFLRELQGGAAVSWCSLDTDRRNSGPTALTSTARARVRLRVEVGLGSAANPAGPPGLFAATPAVAFS